MSKRILITSFTFPPQKNGVAHVVAAHARGLARLGHEVTVATAMDPARENLIWNGVKIRQFDTRGNGMLGRGGYSGEIAEYKKFIASFTGDLIICHCWQIWSTDLAADVFDYLHCPKVLVSHGVSARCLFQKSLKGFIAWLAWKPYLFKLPDMLQKFDHIVILSEHLDSKSFFDHSLMHRIGYLNHSVIPNGIYEESFRTSELRVEEFRARYGIGKKPMLLYVSNYDRRKNQRMAIEAFIKAGLLEGVLVLIGTEINGYARDLQMFAKKNCRTGQQIIFLEKLSIQETATAFCAADLFICSSKWELQPLVILESLAAGKPFICTNVGCVRDIPGGIIVSDLQGMARAIHDLIEDEPRRQYLGRQGKVAIKDKYTWEKIVKQYDALIEKLCSH
jgi:glycosyltransferase involved in cell wall biosynthesis